MTELVSILSTPQFWGLVALYWVFNAAVEALPEPVDDNSAGYKWAYKFLNTLSGNVQEAFKSKMPGAPKG